MTIDKSREKSSRKDPIMNTVHGLIQMARRAVITHDAKVIINRLRAMRARRFPTQRQRAHTTARARRSPASVRRATVDSGGSTDPDPEPPRRRRAHHIYSLPSLGGAL